MNLRALVEKTPDSDLRRESTGFAAERLMELEVGATGAATVEKNRLRKTQCSGYSEPDWETPAGAVELRIPKHRRRRKPQAPNGAPSPIRSVRR
ncbi:transposase [Sinorhizobium meliloti]|uniref:transposase n=1 Tax=Rhizobium meliloti TaxID=382 RepID=UPI0020901E75|nr:transposase [Sinorhizobium meliloti]MCO5965401.1 transposase [Sinorhizobium meliloti]